eukprot:1156410-Pelagomonas_calceolata.AAC.3
MTPGRTTQRHTPRTPQGQYQASLKESGESTLFASAKLPSQAVTDLRPFPFLSFSEEWRSRGYLLENSGRHVAAMLQEMVYIRICVHTQYQMRSEEWKEHPLENGRHHVAAVLQQSHAEQANKLNGYRNARPAAGALAGVQTRATP